MPHSLLSLPTNEVMKRYNCCQVGPRVHPILHTEGISLTLGSLIATVPLRLPPLRYMQKMLLALVGPYDSLVSH